MSVRVLAPGLLTTLQDRGRNGYAALGVGCAGPMDEVSFRLANALAGNDADAAALELTLAGPRLRFEADAVVALTGAALDARVGARLLPAWRPVAIAAGEVVALGATRRGARAYLAVGGGFAAERVLGSASTDLNARIGPFGGRALAAGDLLAFDAVHAPPARRAPPWSLDPRPWFDADAARPLRLMRGRDFDALDAASRTALFATEFRVGVDSNRVGLRLDGTRLALAAPLERVSEPVATGTLQLPPDGCAIALAVEHPTVGGYPQIAQIAAVDLPRLAQRRPGAVLRFREIDVDAAQTRYLRRERELARLCEAIGERLGTWASASI
ncbi:MAG TPA: biotin-dependent carboxyltransferase family protein [Dokdonella sp.]